MAKEFCANEQILEFLQNDQIEKVQELINQGFDLDQKDIYGFSPLHTAVILCNITLVEQLLKLGADPNVSSIDTAEQLLDVSDVPASVPTDAIPDSVLNDLQSLGQITPLQIAINSNEIEIVSLLLLYKADPNAKDLGGCTPLHWAANGGNEAILDDLLVHHAQVNVLDSAQSTPLHEASRKNLANVVKKLLKAGANPAIKDITGLTPLEIVKERNNELYLFMINFIDQAPEGVKIH
jgi:cytohesin